MHYHSVGCENHLQFEDAQEALRAYDDDDDNDDNGEISDVHRKQTTQQDFLDSDYSFSLRFNTPYNVQK